MNPDVITIGLGYIGLPTSALIASHGTRVLGVDINETVVNTINQGRIHIVEPDLEHIVSKAVANGNLKASTKPVSARVFLIVVPTPLKQNHEPDISSVEAATKEIIPLLSEGDLLIIESTCPIGSTEKMQKLIVESRPDLKGSFYIAYCPERVLPGNVMHELVFNDRVIGGVDDASSHRAVEFYSKYIRGNLHVTNARTAEMCKLVENSSRDCQIAFANELSIICDKARVDVWELINLANKHPRVNLLRPGCGVGGHCIAVDPYFISAAYPLESKIIATAREVNNYKSFWCAEKIENEKLKFEIKYAKKPKVALMGLAFKPDIDDLRESPAKIIAQKVCGGDKNSDHLIVEPNIATHDFFELTSCDKAMETADIIVFLVAHKQFLESDIPDGKIILDFCGLTNLENEKN